MWYDGAGLANKRYLMTDERGSVTSVTDASGAVLVINAYDEFGIPRAGNLGRFQYTGQMWLGEIGLYHYKARMYSPMLGRFMQTDPLGYADGMNLYAYVGNDPVNLTDPLGIEASISGPIVVTGNRSVDEESEESDDVIVVTGRRCDMICRGLPGPSDHLGLTSRIAVTGGVGRRAPQNGQCFGPPAAPGTGSKKSELAEKARSNAKRASSHYWDPLNIFWFRSKVQNNGAWDYKQDGAGYQDFGNYNYGRAGAAMGLATDFLLGQAGRAQQAAGTSRPEWGYPGFTGYGGLGGTGSYGDDPHDQEMIRRGISDQRNGC